jgi:Zn-finger nucleic acid-binding protein
MKCPVCDVDLKAQVDRGVDVMACPNCQGMWMTPTELDQLENEAFDNEADKGSLYLVTRETEMKCPVCSDNLKRFNYRFFDLEIDCCVDHGFWLDKGADDRILELMKGEEERVERDFGLEDMWAKRMAHLRSPSFFTRLRQHFTR